ncbi:ATP-binding cassette domain-containing protein [Leptolyngbya sp. BC1307]|uniref:ATP-binding cassette domain-containing protein n=1 Tax=Leptolyngbya sp. BC1307 TaxID=2029589 RepID=UPI000EFD7D87
MAQVVLKDIYKTFPSSPREAVQATSADAQREAQKNAREDVRKDARKGAQIDLPAGSVLRQINLTVDDGEFMVLVGPSGCGKSTLLRLISGLESLTSGDIWVGDRQVNRLPPKQRDIAMVFQSYALYPHLSVYDNLAFGLRRTRLTATDPSTSKPAPRRPAWLESVFTSLTRPLPHPFRYRSATEDQIAQRVRSVAQMLQIEALLSRLPKQLSGGQKQRVALGRAMARNPQVFLMDEPLSNLDAKLRTETRAQIVNLQRQLGTTTIYVTHDQTEAMTMGDRIAVMNQGEIQQVAPPLELYRRPANRFVAAFIGSPPMNFLPVTVKAGQLVHPAFTLPLPSGWQQALAPYQDQPVTLGMRPEHMTTGQQPGSVPITVTQFEALGSETFVMATFASDPTAQPSLQIRVSAEQPVQIGSTLQVSFPAEQIHLFDTLTEIAIRPE